jgi:hypothetical protein
VIALDEILHHELPVGIGGIGLGMGDFRIGDAVKIEVRPKISESGVEIDRRILG